jgi:hypothetical protein
MLIADFDTFQKQLIPALVNIENDPHFGDLPAQIANQEKVVT